MSNCFKHKISWQNKYNPFIQTRGENSHEINLEPSKDEKQHLKQKFLNHVTVQAHCSFWSLNEHSIQSEFSWRQACWRASDTGWEQARLHCTQKRRTWGTKCVPSGSVGRHVCWLRCGSRGRGGLWCRRRWTRRWSSARGRPEWRKYQTSLKPRRWCESDSRFVECLKLKERTKDVMFDFSYRQKKSHQNKQWIDPNKYYFEAKARYSIKMEDKHQHWNLCWTPTPFCW